MTLLFQALLVYDVLICFPNAIEYLWKGGRCGSVLCVMAVLGSLYYQAVFILYSEAMVHRVSSDKSYALT